MADAPSSSSAAIDVQAIWDSIRWVRTLTDAALRADAIAAAFDKIMYELPPPDDDAEAGADDDETGAPRRRLQTEKASKRKREMREDLDDLLDDKVADEGEEVEDSPYGSEDDDEDGFDDDEFGGDEFTRWIGAGGIVADEERGPEHAPRILSDLEALRLGKLDEAIAASPIPERLNELAIRTERPGLRSRPLPTESGKALIINRELEALWILRQLTSRGHMLTESTYACLAIEEGLDSPLVRAISCALRLMIDELKEPAFIAIHHRDEMAPLLHALWSEARVNVPNPSFAYSAATGERILPHTEPTNVFFPPIFLASATHVDAIDSMTTKAAHGRPTIRKPSAIELGRLLVAILDLDARCHALQYGAYLVRTHFGAIVDSITDDIIREHILKHQGLLNAHEFTSEIELVAWQSYSAFWSRCTAESLADNSLQRISRAKIRDLGLMDAFDTYMLDSHVYQENLRDGIRYKRLATPPHPEIFEWIEGEAAKLQAPISGADILQCFNRAIVEEFGVLPEVINRVYRVICADGQCVITPTGSGTGRRRAVKISRFFEVNQRHYLDLLRDQSAGLVQLELVVEAARVREELALDINFGTTTEDLGGAYGTWARERARAVALLVSTVVARVMRQVERDLQHEAEGSVLRACMRSLGHMCAVGPFEETRLALQGFNDRASTWESGWNCLEALPVSRRTGGMLKPARVCGVFRGDNNITVFAVVDERGNVRGVCRWIEADRRTADGALLDQQQRQQLLNAFGNCTPEVIAVAASSMAVNQLVGQLRHFAENDVLNALGHTVHVIWAPSVVATTFSWSDASTAEFPATDVVLRAAISVARYVADPLLELCRLFNASTRDVLRLPLGIPRTVSAERVYESLCWEMSLWVTAVGVDVNALRERAAPEAILQFIAGFGSRKSASFARVLLSRDRFASREELLEELSATPIVAKNAISSLRVFADESLDGDTAGRPPHEPLDATLVHPDHYEAARDLLKQAMRQPTTAGALARLMFHLDDDARRAELMAFAHGHFGNREWLASNGYPAARALADLAIDELCALGRSFMRRPFRIVSSEYLMKLVTGVHFVRRNESAPPNTDLVVREGDVLQGLVDGVSSRPPAIRVRTSRGLMALIHGEDISSADIELALQQIIVARNGDPTAGLNEDDRIRFLRGAEHIAKGKPIFGEVIRVNHDRCEVRLRWIPAPDPRVPVDRRKLPPTQRAAIEPVLNGSAAAPSREFDRSSQISITTQDLERPALVNASKFSHHALFRDANSSTVAQWLTQKAIGEVLLRPHADRKMEGVFVVRVGDEKNSIANIGFMEERDHSGAVKIVIVDRRAKVKREFVDVDHAISCYIEVIVKRIMELRNSRRFQPTKRHAESWLREQIAAEPRRLAYCFTEYCSRHTPQDFYHVLFCLPGKVEINRFTLHIDCDGIYLCLKDGKLRCSSAEDCAKQLKQLVSGIRSGGAAIPGAKAMSPAPSGTSGDM